jgi:diguanylate cyclase (GGDEF)-like protein
MKRTIMLLAGGCAVFASYLAVLFGVTPDGNVGGLKIASIVLPGLVTGAVLVGYFLWDSKNLRSAHERANELSAQLVRKEIEIGRLATVDELTGLYTRREFDEMIRLEFERRRRHGREFALLLLEIDDIAELGENVGTLNKGFLIAEVSAILKHIFRTNDLGCRYTHDSLALLLPETNVGQARVVSERVRLAVSQHDFLQAMDRGGSITVTVSQGIAMAGNAMQSHTELIKTAEKALTEARAAGFDQVQIIDAEGDAPSQPTAA